MNMKKVEGELSKSTAKEPSIFEILGMIGVGVIIIEIGLSIF